MDEQTIIAAARLWFKGDYAASDIAAELDLDKDAAARICNMLFRLTQDVINPMLKARIVDAINEVL